MKIIVKKINETYYQIEELTKEQRLELKEYMSAYAKGYEHNPKFKQRVWNGKIYYFDAIRNIFACGLKQIFISFCEKFSYQYKFEGESNIDFDPEAVEGSIKAIFDGTKYYPRDYQFGAINEAMKLRRGVLQLATGAGKSILVYSLARLFLQESNKAKILIVVPTVMLVKQIFSDFKDYGWNPDEYCSLLYAGKEIDESKPVLISTYQSLAKYPKEFFEQFQYAIVDEAHGARGNSMMNIMKAATNAFTRIGLTGTMPKEKCEYLNVVSVLGQPIYQLKSKELMDRGVLAKLNIVRCLIDHTSATRKLYSGCDYISEQKLVQEDIDRNKVLFQIIDKLPADQNILILCDKLEQLNLLTVLMNEKYEGLRTISNIHGKIKADKREMSRKLMDLNDDEIGLTFGDIFIVIKSNTEIPLSNGTFKIASDITEEDDVLDEWVLKNK